MSRYRADFGSTALTVRGRGVTIRRLVGAFVVALVGLLGMADPAFAHSSFEGSTPEDGALVDSPVSEIVVGFSEPVTPVAEGFEVFTPEGQIVQPLVRSDDARIWTLILTEDLVGGRVGVRFEVSADNDGHVFSDGFSFVVEGLAPTVSTGTSPAASLEERLSEFLDEAQDEAGAEVAISIGRRLAFVALLLTIGLAALAFGVVVDRPLEVSLLYTAMAYLGAALLLGSVLETYGLVGTSGESLFDAVRSSLITTPLLRLVAAGMIIPIGGAAARSVAGDEPGSGAPTEVLAVIGVALGVVSFGFDGHTVSEGPRLIHGMVNAVHVAAAGVWVGGLVGLTGLLGRRIRRGVPVDGALLVIRFSSIATVALACVVLSGSTMAFFVLDQWGDLTSTPWGRRLVVKLGLVALAVVFGGYNHFRVLPSLVIRHDDADLLDRSYRTMLLEAVALLLAAAVAASLVAASPD